MRREKKTKIYFKQDLLSRRLLIASPSGSNLVPTGANWLHLCLNLQVLPAFLSCLLFKAGSPLNTTMSQVRQVGASICQCEGSTDSSRTNNRNAEIGINTQQLKKKKKNTAKPVNLNISRC